MRKRQHLCKLARKMQRDAQATHIGTDTYQGYCLLKTIAEWYMSVLESKVALVPTEMKEF